MTNLPEGIYFNHVSLAYDSKVVVDDATGFFPQGSMTAIVGPNGGGKTTLFKALMGSIKPYKGSIEFTGVSRMSVAYMSQSHTIDRHFPLNVFDMVAMGHLQRQGLKEPLSSVMKEETQAALEAVGLGGHDRKALWQLSGGQLQRALFARLSLQKASIILLDEPFAAVDPYTLDDLIEILHSWQRKGATILMISHDLDIVRNHFSHCLLLVKKVIAWGPTSQVLTLEAIRHAKILSRQMAT